MSAAPTLFIRSRLHEQLDAAFAGCRTVWISGIAGAGKTTFVNAYLGERRATVIAHHVDEGDRDPALLFARLGALTDQTLGSAPAFPGVGLSDPTVFARRFWRTFWASLANDTVLLLEDVHEFGNTPEALAVLWEGIAAIAVQGSCRLLITGRLAPDSRCDELALRGNLAVIESDALRLTLEEAETMATLWLGRERAQAGADLYTLTQGWMACHVLLLDHLAFGGATPTEDGFDAPVRIYEYLANQVVLQLDPEARQVLGACALLPESRPDWVEKLLGIRDPSLILHRLAARGLLATTAAGSVPRLHPLLGAAVQKQLAIELGMAGFDEVVQNAARLLFNELRFDEAIALLLRHGQALLASRWIVERTPSMLEEARSGTVIRWFSSLPDQVFEANPWLCFWRTVVCDYSAEREANLEEHFRAFIGLCDWTGANSVWTVVAFERCVGMEVGRVGHWLVELEALRQLAPIAQPEPPARRVDLLARWARGWVVPEELDVATCGELVAAFSRNQADLPAVIMLVWHSMCYHRLSNAADLIDAVERSVVPRNDRSFSQLMLAVCKGLGAIQSGRLNEVEPHVQEAVELGRELGVWVFENPARSVAIMAALTRGDVPGAHKWASGLRQSQQGLGWRYSEGVRHCLLAHLAFRSRNWELAQSHVDSMQVIEDELGSPSVSVSGRLIAAQVAFARGQRDLAMQMIVDSLSRLGDGSAPWLRACLHLLAADFAITMNEDSLATSHARTGFGYARAAQAAFFHSIIHAQLARLCAFALERGIEVEYVRHLIVGQGLTPPDDLRPTSWPWALSVRLFCGLSLSTPQGDIQLGSGKAAELFCALVLLGARSVDITEICDLLWPDADGDMARKSFDTTLHRLRRSLPSRDLLELKEGRLGLPARQVWIDLDGLMTLQKHLAELTPDAVVDTVRNTCCGPLLGNTGNYIWLPPVLEEVRAQAARQVEWICRAFERLGHHLQAAELRKIGLQFASSQTSSRVLRQRYSSDSDDAADLLPESTN